MSAPVLGGRVSDWYESDLGRAAADIDEQLTAVMTDPSSWLTESSRARSIAQLHAQIVMGEPIGETTTRIRAWRAMTLDDADRRALVREMGRVAADGFGYPIEVTLRGSRSHGAVRVHVGFGRPSRAGRGNAAPGDRGRFGDHVSALSQACGADVDASVVVHHEFDDAASRSGLAEDAVCSHDLCRTLATAALQRSGAAVERWELTVDDGVCAWLQLIPLSVLRELLVWGAVHHSAPFVPALTALNFDYHRQATGAVTPRSPVHRATGFCKRAFTMDIAEELRRRHDPAVDVVVREMFELIRSAMAELVRTLDGSARADVVAARVAATGLSMTTHLGTATMSAADVPAAPLLAAIAAVNPAGLTARLRQPLPAWDIAFFDHRTTTVHVGTALVDSPRLLSARDPRSLTTADFARLGFVIGHELAHCVIPLHPSTPDADEVDRDRWTPERWLSEVTAAYAAITGQATPRTAREDAADILGLAACVTAARRHRSAAQSDLSAFVARWAAYWDHSLPAHELARRRSSGSHSAPDIRGTVPPMVVGDGSRRLTSRRRRPDPACESEPVLTVSEEVMTW